MKRILAYGYTGFLLIFIGLSLAVKFSFLDDYGPLSLQTVMSGSMEPTIPAGSLVIVKKAPLETIVNGDIITFPQGASLVTHRVINVAADSVMTQGDNNNTADAEPVTAVLGKVVMHIPKIGYWLLIGQTKKGIVALICTLITIWLAMSFFETLLKKDPQGEDYV